MALIKPIVNPVVSFDANFPQEFSFTSRGGDLVYSNKIIIRNNSTNEIVYENKGVTYAFSQTIPNGALTNNGNYNVSFITYDSADNASEESDRVPFYCFTTPTMRFINIPASGVIQNSNYKFQAMYTQTEGEPLQYCQFIVSNPYEIIFQSKEIIPSGNVVETEVFGLEDNKEYYIQIVGATKHGIKFTSEKVKFSVNVYRPTTYALLELSNNCKDGYIEIINNAKIIDGKSNIMPPKYIDDSKIDVLDHTYVKWTNGFDINGDFAIKLWCNVLKCDSIAVLQSMNGTIRINVIQENYNTSDYGKYLVEVYYKMNELEGYIYSDPFSTEELSDVFVMVKRVNNLWDINTEVL